jgi:hypothetical protein
MVNAREKNEEDIRLLLVAVEGLSAAAPPKTASLTPIMNCGAIRFQLFSSSSTWSVPFIFSMMFQYSNRHIVPVTVQYV